MIAGARDIIFANMRFWLAGLVVLALHAQQQPSPAKALLLKIQEKVMENLARLPNYTCIETIERSNRRKHAAKFVAVDTIRLEVAYVEGKELFGWPGAAKIDEPEINKLVGRGAIGNGDFALIPKIIFDGQGVTFQYVSDAPQEGKPGLPL